MATTQLEAIVRFRFHNGDVDEFKRLSAQCMGISAPTTPGRCNTTPTSTTTKRSASSSSASATPTRSIQHSENLARLMDAIVATGSVSGELLGDLSAELRARFTDGGPVQLFAPWPSRM